MNRDSPAAVVSSGDSPLPFPTTTAAAIGEVCQVVDRLTQSLPNQPDVLEIKARLELWRGNTAEARKSWEKCLERNPNYAYAYVGMGSIAAKKGDYAVAADLYRKALALDPTASETRVQLGSALIDSGQPKEAIAVLGQAVGADCRRCAASSCWEWPPCKSPTMPWPKPITSWPSATIGTTPMPTTAWPWPACTWD